MLKSDAVKYYGTQDKVAQALTAAGYRISRQAVQMWGDLVPLARAYQLEGITDGVAQNGVTLLVHLRMYERRWQEKAQKSAAITA